MKKPKICLKGTPSVSLIHAWHPMLKLVPVESVIRICVKALINFALCPTKGSLKCIGCSANAWHPKKID